MKIRGIQGFAAALALTFSSLANAKLIEFEFNGVGSGTFDGIPFENKQVTFTEFSNTDNIVSCGANCLSLASDNSTVHIDSFGLFDFITPTRVFHNGSLLGLSRASGADLFNTFFIPDYDLASTLSPIEDILLFVQWDMIPVETSGGTLVFNDGSTQATFEARLINMSEPASLAVFALGLLVLINRRLKPNA